MYAYGKKRGILEATAVFAAKSIKANLGINGETWIDDVGTIAVVPEGSAEAFAVDLPVLLILYWVFGLTPEEGMALVYMMLIWGFMIMFGFDLIKKAIGIRFPAGDGFQPSEIVHRDEA